MDFYFGIFALVLGIGCIIVGFEVYKPKPMQSKDPKAWKRDLKYLKIFGILAILWGLRQFWID